VGGQERLPFEASKQILSISPKSSKYNCNLSLKPDLFSAVSRSQGHQKQFGSTGVTPTSEKAGEGTGGLDEASASQEFGSHHRFFR
jgi:hypothetical protein